MTLTKPESKVLTNPMHTIQARVYYEDTDAAGIIYHANHLRFAERGRTEFLRSLGYEHKDLMTKHGIVLVVRNIDIDYRAIGRLDDLLDIKTEVASIGNTSLELTQTIICCGKILAEMKVVVVAMTPEGRAVRIPPQLRQIFGEISDINSSRS